MDYRIKGLDCAEEVAILRREVGGKPGVIDIEFDVLNARMSLEFDPEALSAGEIVAAVNATGMQATPWERRLENERGALWQRHGRLVMTAVSGALLLAGFITHWTMHGSLLDTFAGGHGAAHVLPVSVLLLYFGATTAGAWFVLPKALLAARRLRPDMNGLMIVAVIGAIIIGEPELCYMQSGDNVVARTIPMQFRFSNNNRQFVEEVVVHFNGQELIDNITFGWKL